MHIGGGNGNPLQWSCLENPRDGGTWWAAVCGVAQSRTRLRRLSSSSSSMRLWQETAILLSTHRQQNRKGDNERPWRARLTADEQNSDDPEALCSFTTCVFTGHHPRAEHWTRPQGHEDPPARPWPLPQRPDGLLGGKQNEFILA